MFNQSPYKPEITYDMHTDLLHRSWIKTFSPKDMNMCGDGLKKLVKRQRL